MPAGVARVSALAGGIPPDKLAEAVREAYKKHAAELLAIEDAQQKLTLLLLGVFGAGVSFLASAKAALDPWAKGGITAVVFAMLLLAAGYTYQRNLARQAVRGLLVACEEALGFFEPGRYLTGAPLYPIGFLNFPNAGAWLGWLSFAVVVLGGIGFLLVLWFHGA